VVPGAEGGDPSGALLRLVVLTDHGLVHLVLHKMFHIREMKIASEAVEHVLDALVTVPMDCPQEFRP
jgi:hypothetical protein